MQLMRLFEKRPRGNASFITLELLKKLSVPVTSATVTDYVETHPDYPSLFSISDSLTHWNVKNLALQIEPESLDKLPVPFIAHTRKEGGSFVLVNSVNRAINYLNEKGKVQDLKTEEFIKDWSGSVLLAEPGRQSGQKNYYKERKKEILDSLRLPAILVTSLGLVFLYALTNSADPLWSFLFQGIKLAGIVMSGLILLYEMDNFNPLVKQICQAGKNLNCKAVLGSKHAKLFNLVDWGEIGFFYFAGGFLYLLLGHGSQLALLSWFNLAALPYIIFSVVYQWRIARQWCPLCLTVQGLLALEGIVCYFNYWNKYQPLNFSLTELVPLLTSFLLPVFFWLATKKVYIDAIRGKQYRKEASQFKYNREFFHSLLLRQKPVVASTEGLGILLGNPEAKNTIIKVCNPYCGPCANAHPVIDELLEQNKDNVKVQIIFTATDDDVNPTAKPVKHLMALYKKDKGRINKVLDDWYNAEKKDYAVFAEKHPLKNEAELEKQRNELRRMSVWCNETDIKFTPTFFINGYQLPNTHRVEDLKYFL
jgi:uncharacterized membrane protein